MISTCVYIIRTTTQIIYTHLYVCVYACVYQSTHLSHMCVCTSLISSLGDETDFKPILYCIVNYSLEMISLEIESKVGVIQFMLHWKALGKTIPENILEHFISEF